MSYPDVNIAIVGAGASGLFLARKLSEQTQLQVTLFEKNRQVGAKLRASGGGKANLFNRDIRPEHYNRPAFIASLLQQFTPEQLDRQFAAWGLVTITDEEGRVYPASQFSQTVVDVLTHFPNDNVRIETESNIQHICKVGDKWRIDDHPTLFNTVVLASGSPAGMIPKNQRGYNRYLQDLSLNINPLKPSLSGFILKNYPKSLSGCRTKAIVSLYQSKTLIHKEFGEITFKDEGVSGIVVMNLSAFYRRLPSQKNCRLEINLTYWDEQFDIETYLQQNQSVIGILHPKLAALYQQKPFSIQHFSFEIEDTYPLDTAQVCHGGIDLSQVDGNFAVKGFPNLYALGELLDVDGVCGGYNLFFAFASAALAAKTIIKALNE